MDFALNRWKAFLIVALIWAGIYLPGLGRPEVQGRESRRVLAAEAMLKTGNLVVPSVGERDYYYKPPGINWLIAGSWLLTGEQSEFTARLPSAVFVLILATLLIWLPYPWLDIEGRLTSALIFLTTIAIIDAGRIIAIEAVYISLTGIATLLWLYLWSVNKSRWMLWVIPSLVLAFGMLVKGPFIIIFFYSVAISVLWYSGKWKELFRVEHFAGLAIVAIITAGWFYLAFQRAPAAKMTSQMSTQLLMRIFVKPDFAFWGWNVVRAFGGFLPWLLFVPMLWDKKVTSQIAQPYEPLFRGCRLGLVVGFTVINLMPGMFARYSMPVFPLASVLTGWALTTKKETGNSNRLWKTALLIFFIISCFTAAAGVIRVAHKPVDFIVLALAICTMVFVFWKRNTIQNNPQLILTTAALTVVFMLQYSTFGLDIAESQEGLRKPVAMSINKIVPADKTIYIFNPDGNLLSFCYYVREPVSYLYDVNDVGEQMHYLILSKADFAKLKKNAVLSSRLAELTREFSTTDKKEYKLVRLN